MRSKFSVTIILLVSTCFLLIAIQFYPGGTYNDLHSTGFSWRQNFISDLFHYEALNGKVNKARIWAYIGIFLYSIAGALFFLRFSQKVPARNASKFLKYSGISTLPFTLLIITPLHDLMLSLSNVLFWTCITVISSLLLRTRKHFLIVVCLLSLSIFYYACYLYANENWDLLALVQKVNVMSAIAVLILLDLMVDRTDFILKN